MVTTIQVDEKTILLLKKVKESLAAASYDEAIIRMAKKQIKPEKSIGGSLKKYYKNYNTEKLVRDLQKERRNEQ